MSVNYDKFPHNRVDCPAPNFHLTVIPFALLLALLPAALFAQQNTTPNDPEYRQNSIGISVGSAFAAPLYIVTLHGTYAPWKWSFFELGMDVGFGTREEDVDYFSFYPFIHHAFLLPFPRVASWYVGVGAGMMLTTVTFPEEGKIGRVIFAADATTGFIFRIGITVSYTFRTNFSTADNKVAVGYLFRFK